MSSGYTWFTRIINKLMSLGVSRCEVKINNNKKKVQVELLVACSCTSFPAVILCARWKKNWLVGRLCWQCRICSTDLLLIRLAALFRPSLRKWTFVTKWICRLLCIVKSLKCGVFYVELLDLYIFVNIIWTCLFITGKSCQDIKSNCCCEVIC